MKNRSNPPILPKISVPEEVFDPLSHYNWDFRTIPDSLLKDAIGDEYLRAWPEFRDAAITWLKTKIDGRSVRDHIIEAASKKQNRFPEKVSRSIPPEWYYPFHALQDDCCYPVPFTWQLEMGIIQARQTTTEEPTTITVRPGRSTKINTADLRKKLSMSQLVEIRPLNKDRIEFATKMMTFPEVGESYGYHLKINFDGHRNEDLVKAFAYWLTEEAKKRRKVAVRGKASAPRWHRLKQLAAKRLSDAGLTYKDAMRFIAKHKEAVPMNNINDVLPEYVSHGAWSDAVKGAAEMIEHMKQNFHLQDWELL